MIAVNRNEYQKLRNLLVCSPTENILKLKTLYGNEINSTRMMNRIKNIKELIEILEKRGCISENDITIFIEIANEVFNTEFLTYYNNNIVGVSALVGGSINNNNSNSGRVIINF